MPAERHYGMDWLRIGAFGLLILYHIGMFFVHWPWHVKTAVPIEWVAVPMLATNAWRLALLFVVSGYASAALLAKGGSLRSFAASRTARLLIPLAVAMVVFVPPQPWVELVTQHGYTGGFLHFWARDYFRFGEVAPDLLVPTWQHLWFVAYLWVYTLLLALLVAVIRGRPRQAIAAVSERSLSGILVVLTPLALLLLNLASSWPGSSDTHALVDDWGAHRIYFPAFLFGFFLRHASAPWVGIRRWWPLAAALSLIGYAVVAWVEIVWPGFARPPMWALVVFGVARIVQGWGAIIALLGIADRFWNHDHPWRATLAEGVFPFYIVHQTIIVVAGWWLLRFSLPPVAEFAILLAITAAGCWAFYDLGRRIGWLRPLIGLARRKKEPPPEERGPTTAIGT